jgi:hypothetical protein
MQLTRKSFSATTGFAKPARRPFEGNNERADDRLAEQFGLWRNNEVRQLARIKPSRTSHVPWMIGAGEGNRTLVFSLEGCCSTIELHPRAVDQLTRHSSRLNHPYAKATAKRRP